MRALGRWIGVEIATWLIAGTVLVLAFSLAMPWAAAIALGIGITVVIALMSWMRRGRTRLARYRDMDGVDDMTGEEFEDWLAGLIISMGGEEWVVQAKRQARPVGVAAVQQAAAARPHYDADGAMVVTNTTFTAQAVTLAESADVVLWDRDDIAAELLSGRATAAGHEVR